MLTLETVTTRGPEGEGFSRLELRAELVSLRGKIASNGSCGTDPQHEAEPMELSDYMLETLRQDGEFILSRGRQRRQGEAGPPTILLVTPRAEHPAPARLRRMEQDTP